jgi:hypothetical protein
MYRMDSRRFKNCILIEVFFIEASALSSRKSFPGNSEFFNNFTLIFNMRAFS